MTSEHRERILLAVIFFGGIVLATLNVPCPAFFAGNALLSKLCSHKLVEIVHKIGEAFVIAPLLAFIVDEALKKKLLRDASTFMIGHVLPGELREHLQTYLRSPLVRTRWDVTYTIEKWTNDKGEFCEGYVKLSTISEYDMQNYAHTTNTYKFRFEVEDSLHKQVGNTKITSVLLPGDAQVLEGAALEREVYAKNGYQRFPETPRNFRLKSSHKPGTPIYTFKAESIECFRDSGYSQFWAGYPVVEANLTVLYPKKDFDVSLELTFDDNEAAEKEELSEGTKWKIRGPILIGQGFIARWDAKPPASAGLDGAAVIS
jgi:hypothetical protein